MRKIRIGKDIVLKWSILTNGEPISLEGRNLKMFISNVLSGKIEIEFSITSNTIEAVFRGTEQKMLGAYRLTLWENYGEDNQSVVDYCDAFQLVSSTCEENDEVDGIQSNTIINLETSNFEIISRNGIYSPRIKYIHTITQDEYDSLEVKDENTLYVVI